MSRSHRNSASDSETEAGSVCETEDLTYDDDDADTRFSGDNQLDEDEETSQGFELEAILNDYFEEQESSPSPGTSKSSGPEVCKKKCQAWLEKAGLKSSADTDNSSEAISKVVLPPEAEIPIEKMAALLKDQLVGSTKTYQTYGSDAVENGERTVPLAPISQLASDISSNLPEALMAIIACIKPNRDHKSSEYSMQMKRFLLEVLRHSLELIRESDPNQKKEMDATVPEIEQLKSFADSTESFDEYFCEFAIRNRTPRTNKYICEEIEQYVNMKINCAKKENTPWICISNMAIYNIIVETNQKRVLFLAPEKVAKYANSLQTYIWDDILNRCLNVLKDWGFNLRHIAFDQDESGAGYFASVNKFSLSQESHASERFSEPVLQLSQEDEIAVLAIVANENDNLPLAEIHAVEDVDEYSIESFPSNSQGDSELEFLRGDSQSNSLSLSPTIMSDSSLPRRSPEYVGNYSPRYAQLTDGFADQPIMNFRHFANLSPHSYNSDDSNGPSPKFPRVM